MSVRSTTMAVAGGAAAAVVLGLPALRAAYVAGRASTRPALAEARHAAQADPLTGLANRAGVQAELARRAAARAPYALLLVDLDGFKAVNDTFGHAAGDAVLVEVARRLSGLVADLGLAARLGGDEFVVIASSPAAVFSTLLARDVARAIARPMDAEGHRVRVGGSVGVVHAMPGHDARELLRAADVAMYRAKTTRAGVVEYDLTLGEVDVDEQPAARLRDMVDTGRDLAGVTR
ncbi:diguanylate cyclase domain-containing protein [Planosporangium sp. 12N6]|uniref:diguanylate cyclase domain-containing protein n=1 Tax=Planosporangium spinosum TaxID=3402278 RepID=UPI003CE982FE